MRAPGAEREDGEKGDPRPKGGDRSDPQRAGDLEETVEAGDDGPINCNDCPTATTLTTSREPAMSLQQPQMLQVVDTGILGKRKAAVSSSSETGWENNDNEMFRQKVIKLITMEESCNTNVDQLQLGIESSVPSGSEPMPLLSRMATELSPTGSNARSPEDTNKLKDPTPGVHDSLNPLRLLRIIKIMDEGGFLPDLNMAAGAFGSSAPDVPSSGTDTPMTNGSDHQLARCSSPSGAVPANAAGATNCISQGTTRVFQGGMDIPVMSKIALAPPSAMMMSKDKGTSMEGVQFLHGWSYDRGCVGQVAAPQSLNLAHALALCGPSNPGLHQLEKNELPAVSYGMEVAHGNSAVKNVAQLPRCLLGADKMEQLSSLHNLVNYNNISKSSDKPKLACSESLPTVNPSISPVLLSALSSLTAKPQQDKTVAVQAASAPVSSIFSNVVIPGFTSIASSPDKELSTMFSSACNVMHSTSGASRTLGAKPCPSAGKDVASIVDDMQPTSAAPVAQSMLSCGVNEGGEQQIGCDKTNVDTLLEQKDIQSTGCNTHEG